MHARSVHYREEQIYYTCWATGSNIDSIVLVWNTGIFSAQKLIPTPVLAEKSKREILPREIFGKCSHLGTPSPAQKCPSRERRPRYSQGMVQRMQLLVAPDSCIKTLQNKESQRWRTKIWKWIIFPREGLNRPVISRVTMKMKRQFGYRGLFSQSRGFWGVVFEIIICQLCTYCKLVEHKL